MESGSTAESLGFRHRFIRPSLDAGAASDWTILLLHGTGGDENDLIPLGRALAPGAALLSPRGNVVEGTMPRFFRRLAEGVFDQEDLARRTEELVTFVQRAVAHYGLDAERVIAAGFSNGANIAASVLLTEAGVSSHAVLFRAMVPFEPTRPAQLGGTPVLIAAGEWDPIATPEQARRLEALLSAAGATPTLSFFDAGHQLTRGDIVAAADWIAAVTDSRSTAPKRA